MQWVKNKLIENTLSSEESSMPLVAAYLIRLVLLT
jgi:hypothetical protein